MSKFELIDEIGSKKEHVLINSDNLLALELLKKQYENSIDLIYIDPPYNTGKRMGKYTDSFGGHKGWLEFMEPRLILAKEFLSNSGLIFISIGEAEEAYLKILCNDIFGEENKVSSIIWQCKYTVSNDKAGITSQTEYILVYAKDANNIEINNDPLREEYVADVYKNIDNDPRGPWRGGVQLYKKKNKHSYTVVSPTGKKWTMPWNYSEEQWEKVLVKNKLIYWGTDGNSCPVKKVFLNNNKGRGIRNLWLGDEVGYTADGGNELENMLFDRNEFLYPKPVSLMKRILQIASKPDSIIMDFFAGSCSMGQAVLEFNKENGYTQRFIMVTNNENNICTGVAFPRLKNVICGYTGKNKKEVAGTGGSLLFIKPKPQ